jgi:HAD superfamily hydrolase (TIGR01484 family)
VGYFSLHIISSCHFLNGEDHPCSLVTIACLDDMDVFRLQLDVKLIFSHGLDLDVLPKGAGKGEALAFLLHKMKTEGWAPQETLVCGDSGNDIELFEVEGVNGVIVSSVKDNSEALLLYSGE